MTSEERLWSAIRLEKPDRVPVIPTLLPEPAAYLTGVTMADVAGSNQLAIDCMMKVFDEYGGWDNPYPGAYRPIQMQAAGINPMKIRMPGTDLPENHMWQLDEQEILMPEDYDKICEMGIEQFYYEDYIWRITPLNPEEVPKAIDGLKEGATNHALECGKRGVKPFFMGSAYHPFFTLSLMRSMVPFTEDLYYNPDQVERTIRSMTDALIPKCIEIIKKSGINILLFTEERASGAFYPLSVFERFWWPFTQEIVDAFWSEGIVTVFHLDQCWDKNIQYFKKLPKGSAILELDSLTDIFRAKELLRGHLCFHGDVPAALLTIGEPEEVAAYCRKLIDEVGGDGGFILGSGCSVPSNVKAENFRAMIETGKNYELSRKI
jgi:uroporphyrinogen-III decarboxylase